MHKLKLESFKDIKALLSWLQKDLLKTIILQMVSDLDQTWHSGLALKKTEEIVFNLNIKSFNTYYLSKLRGLWAFMYQSRVKLSRFFPRLCATLSHFSRFVPFYFALLGHVLVSCQLCAICLHLNLFAISGLASRPFYFLRLCACENFHTEKLSLIRRDIA